MDEAVVETAGVANDGNQLAFLTLGSVAAVREHLLAGLRLAVLWVRQGNQYVSYNMKLSIFD